MKYIKFILFLLLIIGCTKNTIFNKRDMDLIEVGNQISVDVKIDYFDSLQKNVKKISFYEGDNTTYIEFYENQAIKYFVKSRFLGSSDNFKNINLSNYHFINYFQEDGNETITYVYYDSFYESGKKKTKLIPSSKKNVFYYFYYYENGNIKSKKMFKHQSYGEFFVPIGEWSNYDFGGKLIEKFHAPDKEEYNRYLDYNSLNFNI